MPQSGGTVQIVSTLSCPDPSFFGKPIMAGGVQAPCGSPNPGSKPTLKPFYTHSLNPPHSLDTQIYQSNPVNPPHPHSPQPTHRLTHPHLSNPICPFCKTHPHTTEYLFNCTYLYTSNNILDLWMSPGRVVLLLARWKGRLAGLP